MKGKVNWKLAEIVVSGGGERMIENFLPNESKKSYHSRLSQQHKGEQSLLTCLMREYKSKSAKRMNEPKRGNMQQVMRGTRFIRRTSLLALVLLAFIVEHQVEAIWLFGAPNNGSRFFQASSSHQNNQDNRRMTRNLAPQQGKPEQQAPNGSAGRVDTPIISQQFHYFWNHDKIEPNQVAVEANKILADVQVQSKRQLNSGKTNSVVPDQTSRRSSSEKDFNDSSKDKEGKLATKQGDPMQTGASSPIGSNADSILATLIPAPIQQQLTNIVLQMQRQQQASMMFQQPRIDAQRRFASMGMAAPAYLSSLPGRLWTLAGNPMVQQQQQQLAFQPAQLALSSPHLLGADSIPSASIIQHPLAMAAAAQQQQQLGGTANIGGVPIYGPFMVTSPIVQHYPGVGSVATGSAHSPSTSSVGSGHRASSRNMSKRRAWPHFGRSIVADRIPSQLFVAAAASQPRVAIAQPPFLTMNSSPLGGMSRGPVNQISSTPSSLNAPEAVQNLLEQASEKVASAIANHLQVRLAQQQQQKLSTGGQLQDSSQAASAASMQFARAPAAAAGLVTAVDPQLSLLYAQKPTGTSMQAPYLLPNELLGSSQTILQELMARLANNPTSSSSNLSDPSGMTFGSRLKRRHMSILANQSAASINTPANPPYTLLIDQRDQPMELQQPMEIDHYYQDGAPELVLEKELNHNSLHSLRGGQKIIAKKSSIIEEPAKRSNVQQVSPSTDANSSKRLRHLLMIMATESPFTMSSMQGNNESLTHHEDSQQQAQTQLRRLKRSSWIPSGSSSTEKSNKPIDSIKSTQNQNSPLKVEQRSWSSQNGNRSPSVSSWTSSGKSSWVAMGEKESSNSGNLGAADTQQAANQMMNQLTRRQAEVVVDGTASNNSAELANKKIPVENSSSAQENSKSSGDLNVEVNSTNNREDRALKIKRVTASASVLHHPPSTSMSKSIPIKRSNQGFVLTGTPVSITLQSNTPVNTAEKQSAVANDPLSLSMAESTRVANYFQNVENESTTKAPQVAQPAQHQQQQQVVAPHQQSSSNGNAGPQLNVGFSAPTDMKQDGKVSVDSSRQQGNGLGASPGSSLDNSSRQRNLFQNLQNKQQQQQQVPSQGAANSADISSSATRNVAYTVNANPHTAGIPGQLATSSTRSSAALSSFARGASSFRAPSGTSFSGGNNKMLLNALLNRVEKGAARSSSTSGTAVLPGSLSSSSSSPAISQAASTFDRSPYTDQSSNYVTNEELLLPSPPSSTNFLSDLNNGLNQQTFASSFTDNNNQNSVQLDSSGNPMNYGNENNNNNFESQVQRQSVASDPTPIDQVMDLARYSSQQSPFPQHSASQKSSSQKQSDLYGSPLFGQTAGDSLMPQDLTDSTSSAQLLDQNNNPNKNQIFPQVNSQTPEDSSATAAAAAAAAALMVPPPASNQQTSPISQQQQFYSQQIEALGAAVNKYNQHRFNQQAQDATLNSLNNLRAIFASPSSASSHLQKSQYAFPAQHFQQTSNSFAHSPSFNSFSAIPAQHQQANHLWSSMDEEAAARASEAAGISLSPASAGQLMGFRGGQANLNELNGLLMANSEQARSEQSEDADAPKSTKGKKAKSKVAKQVSHHYHINNYGSPLEDTEAQYNPLDIATALSQAPSVGFNGLYGGNQMNNNQKNKKQVAKEEEEEKKEEKPKKKGFLRRFSLKNLFKKLKKDKKKENEATEENSDSSSSSSSSSDN